MATRTIDEIFSDYRLYFLGLRPDANVDQEDSDWWIRGRTFSGVLTGAYADSEKNALDTFPQHARREALLRHIFAYFNENTFQPATVAKGGITIAGGTPSTPFSAGLQCTHDASGNVYTVTANGALDGSGNGTAKIQSVLAGQAQNLAVGTVLSVSSPPAGFPNTVTVDSSAVRDGTNEEDEDRASARVLVRMRSSARGGTSADYEVWARSITGVTSVSIMRFIEGLGTVGVVITSGTTDIDSALDNDEAITFTPSDDLIAQVQAYLDPVDDGVAIETDCPVVVGALEVEVAVTCRVAFLSGDKSTIPSGQTKTQGQLVAREIKRAIYKTPTGGQLVDGGRYCTVKAIQDMVDSKLGADTDNVPVTGDTLQIVTDRTIAITGADDAHGVNKIIGRNERPIPGTITILDWDE